MMHKDGKSGATQDFQKAYAYFCNWVGTPNVLRTAEDISHAAAQPQQPGAARERGRAKR